MGRTALVVLVPEAEAVVGEHRMRHDPMAVRGVPAHVTVLHPFHSPVDPPTAREVEEICATLASFTASFETIGRFPGEVVWLRPEPAEVFAELIRRVVDRFPDCPPYGGAYTESIAHLHRRSEPDRRAGRRAVGRAPALAARHGAGVGADVAGRGRRRLVERRSGLALGGRGLTAQDASGSASGPASLSITRLRPAALAS